MSEEACVVSVAVFAPPYGSFSYLWPKRFGSPQCGVRVRVPFGRSLRVGVVNGLEAEPPEGVALKPTADLLDETPLYDSARSQWLARL
ncbi:MAG: primosomal protein N', partial [Zetaproteobacteria bacterium]